MANRPPRLPRDETIINRAMRRLDRLYGRAIDQMTEAHAAGGAAPGLFAALMSLRADRRRLLLSYDDSEIISIIQRIGKPGSALTLPR